MQVTKSFEIDAAHNILDHYSKCRHLHGHRYRFIVTVEGPNTEQFINGVKTAGMVLDFTYIKQAFQEVIEPWDHSYLCPLDWGQIVDLMKHIDEDTLALFGLHDPARIIAFGCNPTAENMALIAADLLVDWFKKYCPVVDDLHSLTVQVFETPTSSAVAKVYFWGKEHR